MDRLIIFDTTLRDGEQAPGFSLTPDEKLQVARQLERLGADVVEAGFPIASDADAAAVRRIALALERPVVAALARCTAKDIDRAGWAIAPARRGRIHTFLATSDLHLTAKLQLSREDALSAAVSAVRRARDYTDDVEFSAEDATRSDRDYLCRVVEAVLRAGATTINLPDTVGHSTPDEIAEIFGDIRCRVPGADAAILSAHCHDDLGLAVANTLAAIGAGARQVECTINGIGERAGNAALEEVVMATRLRADRLPVVTGIDARELYRSSQLLSRLSGESVQANKAIVGRNAFAHEAGVHQDGMLKDRRTYEILRPEDVGAPPATLVLGKHSGRHAVQRRCEQLGVRLSRPELETVYRELIAMADRKKRVDDEDLLEILAGVAGAIPGDRHDGMTHEAAAHPAGYGFGV
jgi:2-isopropylmalate synthase